MELDGPAQRDDAIGHADIHDRRLWETRRIAEGSGDLPPQLVVTVVHAGQHVGPRDDPDEADPSTTGSHLTRLRRLGSFRPRLSASGS
jgi:hypothetical protein